jgi:hypothetical protein
MKEKLKARLISDIRESENSMFNLMGLIVYPNDPYYGMSAVEANEVCKEVLGDKYELYEANGLFAGVMYNFNYK